MTNAALAARTPRLSLVQTNANLNRFVSNPQPAADLDVARAPVLIRSDPVKPLGFDGVLNRPFFFVRGGECSVGAARRDDRLAGTARNTVRASTKPRRVAQLGTISGRAFGKYRMLGESPHPNCVSFSGVNTHRNRVPFGPACKATSSPGSNRTSEWLPSSWMELPDSGIPPMVCG